MWMLQHAPSGSRTLFHDKAASVILRVDNEIIVALVLCMTKRDEEEIGEGRAAKKAFLQSKATRLSMETRFDNRSASTAAFWY